MKCQELFGLRDADVCLFAISDTASLHWDIGESRCGERLDDYIYGRQAKITLMVPNAVDFATSLSLKSSRSLDC